MSHKDQLPALLFLQVYGVREPDRTGAQRHLLQRPALLRAPGVRGPGCLHGHGRSPAHGHAAHPLCCPG